MGKKKNKGKCKKKERTHTFGVFTPPPDTVVRDTGVVFDSTCQIAPDPEVYQYEDDDEPE